MQSVIAWAVIALLCVVCIAHAEISVEKYQRLHDTQTMQTYVSGVGFGFAWANVALEVNGHEPLYCPPPKLSLGGMNYISILARELKDHPGTDTFIEPALLRGLVRTFPCASGGAVKGGRRS
jgi:hypothetical protein